MPEYEDIRELLKRYKQEGKKHTLMIFDDAIGSLSNLESLYTIGSHHLACSAITLSQSLFGKSESLRILSQNAKYHVIMKSPRSLRNVSSLAQQLGAFSKNQVVSAFQAINRNRYGYLIIDLSSNCPDHVRLRTYIFKHESLCPVTFLQQSK